MGIQGIYKNSPAKKIEINFGLQRLMILMGNKVSFHSNALIIAWADMNTIYYLVRANEFIHPHFYEWNSCI